MKFVNKFFQEIKKRMASSDETQPKLNKVEEEETWSSAMQLSMSIVLPMAMQTAIELGIFEIIAKAGDVAELSAPEIAAQLPTKNPDAPMTLDRILRLLVSHWVLGCSVLDGKRLYSLAPVSKYFVRNQDGVSLAPYMALIQDKVYWNSWFELKNTIVDGGIPFNKAHGKFNEVLNGAMFNVTCIVMKKILDSYKGFAQFNQLVDVGGLEHIGGDMFESIPNGDAILLKCVLHNWDDDYCLNLLKNCYKAIPGDGKIVVIDTVIPITPEISSAARETSLMDAIMLIQLPGGKERTKKEYMELATGAGFKGVNFECVVSEIQHNPNTVDQQEEEMYSYAMQLSISIALPMAMYTALELDVFEIIAKAGPAAKLSALEIADEIPTGNPEAAAMLDRILRLLVSHRVLGCSVVGKERLYSLAPVSKYFVSNQDGVSLRPYMALNQDKVYSHNWFRLKDTILEGGIPFNKVHGMNLYEYLGRDSRFDEVFNKAMFNHSVEHIGGDMFKIIPPGDAILMKRILHNWDNDHCLRILENCYKAIPEDGKVIVIDSVVSTELGISSAARETSLLDVIMLFQLPGGKERTVEEYR
ncbi:hypothetical protein ACOSQ3_000737 [Xanthoceras sorbifolium]